MYYKLTIPEGANIYDIADMVALAVESAGANWLRRSPPRRGASASTRLDGRLSTPGTYYLTDDTDTLKLMERMVAQSRDFYPPPIRAPGSWPEYAEVITLALMIEKEAVIRLTSR